MNTGRPDDGGDAESIDVGTPVKETSCDSRTTHQPKRPGPKPGSRQKERPQSAPDVSPATESHSALRERPSPQSLQSALLVQDGAADAIISQRRLGPLVDLSFASPSHELTGFHSPHRAVASNPLDAVLPRHLLMTILAYFRDLVYCIVPYSSWSDLMQDLAGKREERPNEGEWVAMVLAVVAFTAVQVPHQLAPMERRDVKILIQSCTSAARAFLVQPYVKVSPERLFITYCLAFVSYAFEEHMMSRQYHGINVSLALALELEKEETYSKMSTADAESMRTVWWLIYTGDRSGALSEGQAVMLPPDDMITTEEPTARWSAPRQNQAGNIMDGFRYITRIWRAAGKFVYLRTRNHRRPPGENDIAVRQAELSLVLDQLDTALRDCPQHLILHLGDATSPDTSTFPQSLLDGLHHYTNGHRSEIEDPRRAFLIQQANLYITQLCVKFAGIQHQEYLLKREHPTLSARFPLYGAKHRILSSLLDVIRALPLELIAVNSLPVVTKIRYVASTLLEEMDEALPADMLVRAQDYLTQYLTFLSRIEALYSLADT